MKKLEIDPASEPTPTRFGRLRRFDLGGRGLAASGLSVVTAGALLTGVIPGLDLGNAHPVTELPVLPTLPVLPVENGDPILPDDGLTRVIVTPLTERLEHAATPIQVPTPEDPSGSAIASPTNAISSTAQASTPPPPDDDHSIDDLSELESLRNAPAGSSLVVTPEGIAVRYPDGTIVALDDVLDPTRTATATDDPSTTADTSEAAPIDPSPRGRQLEALAALPPDATVAEQLRSLPGVDTVDAIGDGSYSVALRDPAALDGLAVEVTEQTYLTLFTEPYEPLEWFIENDGATMARYGLNPTLDADIDGTVAIEHATGTGVVVAVVDTGVDFSHPDLAANAWNNPGEICANGIDDDGNGYVDDCHGFDFVYRDGTGYNTGAHAHGTHVAGTIAAARNGIGVAGVAPDAQIMDLNVSRTDGSLADAAISEAVRYAADNGADVINMSLGTKPGGAPSASIGAAIDYAGTKGVLVVVAAGNDNTNLDVAKVWPASYDKPNMMTVGATSPNDTKASFSNYGGAIDVFAPGDTIASTVPVASSANPYAFMSGTSMATPVVVGAAALVLSDDPSMTPQQVIAQLRSTSDIIPALAGFGANGERVNAGEALGGVIANDTPITELAVTMTGLGNVTAAEPFTTSVRFAVPDDTFDEDYRWEMALLSDEADGVYALVDHPVELTGSPTTTGTSGFLDLGVTGTAQITLSAALPAGTYGLLFEAVPTADPTSRLGNPFAVSFTVRAAGTTEPGAPGTGNPGTGSPGTGNPGSGDGGTTSPTPTAPPTGGTTEPAPTTPPTGGYTGGGDTGGNTNPTPPTGDGNTGGGDTGGGTSDPTPPTGGGNTGGGNPGGGGTTNPAPTTPPTGGNPPSSPPTAPPPVEQGRYSVQTIAPFVGRVGESTQVTLTGEFPDPVQVYFGSVEAASLSQTESRLVALAPASSQEGPVTVRLLRNGTAVLTIVNGFTYLAAGDDGYTPPPTGGDGGAGGGTGTTPNPTPGTPGGDSGGGTPTPSPTPAPTPAPGNPGTGNPDTGNPDTGEPGTGDGDPGTGDAADQRARQPRGGIGGERVDLGGGRTGTRLAGPNPLTSAPACRSNACGAQST